jgi:hypothetical protein
VALAPLARRWPRPVPATVVIVGAALIPDTPNSLVLRGRLDEALASLRHIREDGAAGDTDAELKNIVRAVEQDRRHESSAGGHGAHVFISTCRSGWEWN